MARKPGKKQKENPAGCAGESKQMKANIREEKRTVDPAKFEFCDEITRFHHISFFSKYFQSSVILYIQTIASEKKQNINIYQNITSLI